MKTLELNLQKRLLIVEGDMLEFKLNDKRWINDKIKFICKGSELTEEIAENLVKVGDEGLECWDYKKNSWGIFGFNPLESFISAIEAQGYYWGENPWNKYALSTWHNVSKEWKEAESKTFNPDKTLIFEIV